MMAIVRGLGSGGAGCAAFKAAMRLASVTVMTRQSAGLFDVRRSKSARFRPSTRPSRSASTVAVLVPPARKAISPIGWPGPISEIASARPSRRTAKRPDTTMNIESAASPCRTRTSPRFNASGSNSAAISDRVPASRPPRISRASNRFSSPLLGMGDTRAWFVGRDHSSSDSLMFRFRHLLAHCGEPSSKCQSDKEH